MCSSVHTRFIIGVPGTLRFHRRNFETFQGFGHCRIFPTGRQKGLYPHSKMNLGMHNPGSTVSLHSLLQKPLCLDFNNSTGQTLGCLLTNLSFSCRGKMAFAEQLNFGASEEHNSCSGSVTNYTGTHSSMVWEHVTRVGILPPPREGRQLK